ncbi:ABC transporter ATP-binding protein [uncultured Faecalibaculum sp.]|uniref:ABC transporter ATP-binding protein n=1 Tax=uncultured Faecalibaculum sp. TaxID=1729681 RepID=UPI0025F9339B|nr:ABC transporter ATP-binding protein [uncultured Faecalibaculum sp.]
MEEFAVQAEGIWKTYGDRTVKTNALQSCSLQVKPGEFVSIIGPSGSGKSTLLHCLAGLITPEKGTIRVGGQQIDTMTEEQRSDFRLSHIGLVFQFYSLVQELTIEENLRLPFEVNGNKPDTEFLEELKDRLEIRELDHKYPRECSGGQQQRVAIARALSTKPVLLLADEPTGNLDSQNARHVFGLLKECQRIWNQTVIMVTHDLSLAKQADRMLVLQDGKIQYAEQ